MPHSIDLAAIQPTTPADFTKLTEVWEAAVRATHHFLTERDIAFFKPLVLHQFLAAVQCFCIRDKEGNIAGFFGALDDKLEMLFVHPHYQGEGIGKALLQHAIQQLGILKVDVNEQNKAAVDFYTRAGFAVTARSATDALGKPFPVLSMELKPVM